MVKMHWEKVALIGLVVLAWLVASWAFSANAPAVAAPLLGFTSTPTYTPQPTYTATPEPTSAPTLAPQQPTQPPPQPTAPPPPTPTVVVEADNSVPKTGSGGLLGVALAAGLVAILFGVRRIRTSAQ